MTYAAAGASQTGNRYDADYDVYAVEQTADGWPLLVVADGMGSGRGSAFAGRTGVDTFVERTRDVRPDADVLRAAVGEAQRRVGEGGRGWPDLTGCTLTALVGDAHQAWIAHLGDSRVYRWRGGLLEQLTSDHTEAWLGAVNGWWSHNSPQAHTARYHLLRYLGHPDAPEPDVLNVNLRPGDVLLLCTDGIAEEVPYRRLAEVLGSAAAPAEMAASLLADALAVGGNDNATAVVLRVL
ncbi:PP2C family protein-serine/threonine phosphatase [Hamadaea tsunoensis]|uniref:PP2C family protein-serine/threonine phosphatase n=1 Tax=Hamadaea tsunoensis TaxID=53368 RepID=UPI00041A7400|nr:protein phosphatase 2C domain-containing protein [Hamadaea tsunoensis]